MNRPPELRHLPVADLRLRESSRLSVPPIRQPLSIDDDLQQPSADGLRCLLAWTFPGRPRTSGVPVFNMFSHAPLDIGAVATDQ